jgi:hypothetical protein
MINFFREHRAFVMVLLGATVIRFLPAFRYQFSYDELCGLRNSLFGNWHDTIIYGVMFDTHPILVQFIINTTVGLFGYEEFWIKLPFLLFSLGTVIYAYLFALKWFGRLPALLSACVFSFSYIFLFYAPLARMYAGGAFFCTALTYYLFNLCFDEEKKKSSYAWFAFFILLCALNNHLSCLFALICGLFGLFFQDKKSFGFYLGACIVSVLLYLPHLPITLFQLGMGGIGHEQDGWLAPPDKFVLFSFVKTVFGTGFVYTAFIFLLLLSFILKKAVVDKKAILLFMIFFLNYAIIHLYSVYKAPIFQYSVMLFSAPCLIWAITSMIRITEQKAAALTLIVSGILIVQSVAKKHFFTNATLNQNEMQTDMYVRAEDELGKGKVLGIFGGAQQNFIQLYQLKQHRKFNYYLNTDEKVKNITSFKSILKGTKAEVICLGDPSETQLELVKEQFPFLLKAFRPLNANYYEFSKTPEANWAKTENRVDSSRLDSKMNYEYVFNGKKMENGIYRIDSLDEFPFSTNARLSQVSTKEGQVVFGRMKVWSRKVLNDVGFHVCLKNDKDSTLFFGGPDIKVFFEPDSLGYWVYTEMFLGSAYKKWLKQESKVQFFIWNRGKHKFKVSDFKFETINYWSERWKWWD